MANAEISQYHKYIDLQNVSGSGDPASAPAGGIYLFASGAAGSAKLYLQNEGVSTPLSLADGGTLQIAGDSGTDTVNLSGDTFTFAGGEGVVSAVTDNQVSLAVSIADFSSELSSATVADTDEFAISDGGTMKKIDFQHVRDSVFADVSGDATVAAGGALTIANSAVETAMIADDAVTGAKIAADAVDSEHFAAGSIDTEHIADLQVTTGKLAADAVTAAKLADDAVVTANIVDLNVTTAKLAADAVTGAKLADDAVNSEHIVLGALDAEHYSSGSIENGHLAGSIANAKLSNSAVTITAGDGLKDGGSVALGASVTLNIEPNDFAGDGLADDGSDNLTLNFGGMASEMTGDVADGDEFAISDGGTMKKVDFSVVRDAVFADVSGDATIAAGGALTIAAQAVENSMLADDAVGADELAANAVVNASVVDGALKADKLDLDGSTDIGADLVDADLVIVDDGAGGTNRVSALSRVKKYIYSAMSGDATASDSGALTIANAAVEHAMLANDAVDGDNIADNSVNSEHIALGALDSEHYSTGSIESNHLKGSVANAKLANSAVTLGSTSVSLGATTDTIAGLAQLTASFAQVSTGLFPDVAGGATLGNASLGFGDVFIADDKALHFGNGQDVKMEYNEDGDDEFEVTIPANGMRLQGVTPTLIIGDGGGEDTKLIFDGQTADFHVGLDDSADKLSLGLGQTPGSTANMLLDGASRDVEFLGNISVPQTKIVSLDTDGDTSLRASADDVMQLRVGGTDMATVNSLGFGVNGGYTSGNGISLGADGTGNFDGNLNVGRSGGSNGASLTAHGDGANQKMFFNHSSNKLAFFKDDGSGSQETILNIAGAADTDFAIEVANGSDNINKIKAAAFVTYSDESLKSDVTSMGSTALDAVMSLNGVEFTWKDSGERDFGFIAQEVEKVVPKAVHTGGDGVQGVDYSRLTSVLVEAVKAQQVQIEELKAILKK